MLSLENLKGTKIIELLEPLKNVDGIAGVTVNESYTVYIKTDQKTGEDDKDIPLVTIYPDRDPEKRHAQFHEPFHQIGWGMKELRPFIDELKKRDYDINLD